jgi:hypothetical protein
MQDYCFATSRLGALACFNDRSLANPFVCTRHAHLSNIDKLPPGAASPFGVGGFGRAHWIGVRLLWGSVR